MDHPERRFGVAIVARRTGNDGKVQNPTPLRRLTGNGRCERKDGAENNNGGGANRLSHRDHLFGTEDNVI
jgi:hypothetical protein